MNEPPSVTFTAEDSFLLPMLDRYLNLCSEFGAPPEYLSEITETITRVARWQSDIRNRVQRPWERKDRA